MYIKKETTRKYYKYIDTPFAQPTLTSNGTLGGDSFAVQATIEVSGYEAFRAFSSSVTGWAGNQLHTDWYIMYNPIPFNVTKLQFVRYNPGQNFIINFDLYGSNDNITYELIGSGYDTGMYSTYTPNPITISNTKYYKYYKIQATQAYSRCAFAHLYITATQKSIEEATPEDYDFYEDVEVVKALYHNGKYIAHNF